MKLFLCYLIVMLFLSCNSCNNDKPSEISNPLAGTWKYVADCLLDDHNNVIKEDTAVDGLLIYTPGGKMAVQFIWKKGRESIMNDSIMKNDGFSAGMGLGVSTWNLEQSRKLIDTYDAYFGDYVANPETKIVTHVVVGDLRPVKTGTVYKRIYEVKGDSLFLRDVNPLERWGVVCIRVSKN